MDFAVTDAVRESQPGYGGIALLYSGLLRCDKVDLPLTSTFEALCTRFKVGCSAWLLLTIYHPGSSHLTSTFFHELATVLETLVTHRCPVVTGGDINIHVENQSDVNASCLLELLSSMDLQQHVLSPTHQAGGMLDLVITFNDLGVEELTVEPPGIVSDHSLISDHLQSTDLLLRHLLDEFAAGVTLTGLHCIHTSSTVRSIVHRRPQPRRRAVSNV